MRLIVVISFEYFYFLNMDFFFPTNLYYICAQAVGERCSVEGAGNILKAMQKDKGFVSCTVNIFNTVIS